MGPVVAAELLVSWSHRGRVRNEAAFASLAGVAPLEASSGQRSRHRLNRGGDRDLNPPCTPSQLRGSVAIRSRELTKQSVQRKARRTATPSITQTRARPAALPPDTSGHRSARTPVDIIRLTP